MKDKLKRLFVPHEGNNYRPDFLERFSMGVMLVLVLMSFAMANIQALLWVGSDWMVSSVLPSVIVELTNEERADDALGTLKRNSLLDRAAELKAQDMAKKGYFAHFSPEGVSPWYWFEQAGYQYSKAGENLAVHFNDSGKVIDAWMDSPSHRANIMNGGYTEIGVGTAKGEYKGSNTIFVVQLFGTPTAPVRETTTIVSNVETSGTSSPQLASNNQTDDILGETIPEIQEPIPEEPVKVIEPEVVTVPREVASDTPIVVPEEMAIEKEASESEEASTTPPLASTDSGNGAVLEVEPLEVAGSTSGFFSSVTQPSIWLQMVYAVLALVVVVALGLSILIEWQRQHPVQIAYAGGLLAVMALLFHIHTALISGVTII